MKKKEITSTVYDIKIDFEKSSGSYVYDKNREKKFLDFLSMFSSLPLGYQHPIFDKSFEEKIIAVSKIRMANNLFLSEELIDFKMHFSQYLKHPYVHFTSTGALAVEAALKSALFEKKVEKPVFWALEKAFHGINSWGFLTDKFGPTKERIDWYPDSDWQNLNIDTMLKALKDNEIPNELVGIVIEPILCTSGDIYISVEKLKELSSLCRQHNICFILDEIQTGFGPTGKMWYADRVNLDYDILIFGKKSQIMGINVNEEYSSSFKSPLRILEVTFDGDLIDAIRSDYILKAYEKYNLLSLARSRELEIKDSLGGLFNNFRATGNLWAFDFDNRTDRDNFCNRCFESGLLVNKGGNSSVRMRPNLAVKDEEIEDMLKIIQAVI
ncbi:aminotransferase class III-fold pyridoxal phosphate-dependent enzyme [Gammaproteobacteria bacterium]|nr:aminotransferase class III-fold pyridoxal phosphate-dependent enzyme [Gammaproteobacteria bacterium]